jgi:hypothetical protein
MSENIKQKCADYTAEPQIAKCVKGESMRKVAKDSVATCV